jgi:hypothetical protein
MEQAHMACVTNPISQPSPKFSLGGIPFDGEALSKFNGSSVLTGSLLLKRPVKFSPYFCIKLIDLVFSYS